MEPSQILIVEDDERLAELVATYLRRHGFEVAIETQGGKAVERILADAPDAVLLDIGLSGEDGLAICRRVRERYTGKILIFSARGDDVDQVVGLELGADDYVPKPASPRLLLARLRTALREPRASDVILIDALSIDTSRREVRVSGALIELTSAEFDLLWALARQRGQVLTRQDLLQTVRGIDYDGIDRSLDVRVARLRQQLGDIDPPYRFIKTVRGVGYQLVRGGGA